VVAVLLIFNSQTCTSCQACNVFFFFLFLLSPYMIALV